MMIHSLLQPEDGSLYSKPQIVLHVLPMTYAVSLCYDEVMFYLFII